MRMSPTRVVTIRASFNLASGFFRADWFGTAVANGRDPNPRVSIPGPFTFVAIANQPASCTQALSETAWHVCLCRLNRCQIGYTWFILLSFITDFSMSRASLILSPVLEALTELDSDACHEVIRVLQPLQSASGHRDKPPDRHVCPQHGSSRARVDYFQT